MEIRIIGPGTVTHDGTDYRRGDVISEIKTKHAARLVELGCAEYVAPEPVADLIHGEPPIGGSTFPPLPPLDGDEPREVGYATSSITGVGANASTLIAGDPTPPDDPPENYSRPEPVAPVDPVIEPEPEVETEPETPINYSRPHRGRRKRNA